MPNSVMEYMHHELPVVATDISGVRDVVGNDNVPWLFPVGDATTLQRLITRLAEDRSLREELGHRNRQRVMSEFNLSRIMPQWTRLLESL